MVVDVCDLVANQEPTVQVSCPARYDRTNSDLREERGRGGGGCYEPPFQALVSLQYQRQVSENIHVYGARIYHEER